jgi:uncharacterized membrane protein
MTARRINPTISSFAYQTRREHKEITVTSLPLHPALVHVPLGLAFVLPALAIGFSWALWTGRTRSRAWLTIVLLQAVLLGAGLVALNTGQHEEERVEFTVPKAAIETHEAYAELFLWTTGGTLAVAAIVLFLRHPVAIRTLTTVTVLGTFLVAGAALRVGHAGGQLVYVHNAGAAYVSASKASAQAGKDTPVTPLTESRDGCDTR